MSEPYEVSEISKVGGVPDQVVVRFNGPALQVLEQLREAMGLSRREEVVVKAVEVLYGAIGREVLYRDRSGQIETVPLWARR